MAEELGTLQYEMIVSDKKLKESLDKITAELKLKEAEWNDILANVNATANSPNGNQSSAQNANTAAQNAATQAQNAATAAANLAATQAAATTAALNAQTQANLAAAQAAQAAAQAATAQAAAARLAAAQLAAANGRATASQRALIQEERLKIAVDSQQAGSVGRLRAEITLYAFQIRQLNPLIQAERDRIIQLNQAINANRAGISSLQPQLNMWGKLVSAIRTYATAYLSVQAVMGLGKAIFNQTKELDQLAFGMKTVIKSSVELANTQKFLSEVAVNYGGDLLTLSERYIKFRAAAQQSNMSAAETQKIFDSMSKAAGTLGLKTDELSGVYLALEQMISKGKVTTEELRRQLGERLPGAFGIMANALGVTIPQLDKMLKKGEVLSKDALPKFADAIEKAYGIESLKKIDTLAAAQGRMSTEFTGLIKEMNLASGFKDTMNGITSFIGFIKDNIGVIGFFTKSIIALSVGWLLVSRAYAAYNIVAKVLTSQLTVVTLATGRQIIASTQGAVAQNVFTNAMIRAKVAANNLGIAMKSNWIGLLVTGLIAAVAYFAVFKSEAEKTADAMGDLNKEEDALTRKLNYQKKVIGEAEVGTNRYKNAIKEINGVSLKYNQAILEESAARDKANASANEGLRLLKEEYIEKRKVKLLEQAETDRQAPLDKFRETLNKMFDPSEAYDKFTQFQELVAAGASNSDIINKARGNKSIANDQVFIAAINAEREYLKKVAEIEAKYKTKEKPVPFDIEKLTKDLKDAKEEFENLNEVTKVGGKLAAPDISLNFKTNKDYLKSLLVEYAKFPEALELIYLEMAKLDKKQGVIDGREDKIQANRNEALKKLNDKYLADQEEFANFEAGISAGRIAELEDGIEKERKLNELAYENRIKAIEKEKIATLNLLNDARDPKSAVILDLNATGYDSKTQTAISNALSADTQDRFNAEQILREANLKSEKDYAYKINEIRRDVNDQFLTGLEKERAAINEKYDDLRKKAGSNPKLQADIEKAQGVALDEMYRQYEIDQLDFVREIEYKKNEIRLESSQNQRKLDEANFKTYVDIENKKITKLKASANKDQRDKGNLAEQNLIEDKKLFKLKQEKELRDKILDGIKQATDELITQSGMSDEEAEKLKGAVNILSSAAKGDYLSAALSAFGMISESLDLFGKKRDEAIQKHIDYINESIEAQLKYNLALHDSIDLQAKQSIFFNDNANEILIASKKYANAQKEYNDVLANFTPTNDGIGRRGEQLPDPKKGATLEQLLRNLKIPAEFGYQGLLATYPELIKANGEFNSTVAKTILTLNDLPPATTNALNGLIEWSDKMAEAQKATDDAVASMIGNLGSSIYTALSDAWSNGTDSFMAFKNTVSQGLEDIIKQMMFNAIWSASLEEFKQGIIDSYKVGGDQDIFDNIDKFFEKAPENIRLTNEGLAEMDRRAAESGMDWKGNSSSSSSDSVSKNIQALTEDTGRRLEGLINSIRETGVINTRSMARVVELIESSQSIQGYAAQSLGHLRNIDMTTANQLKLFNDLVKSGHSQGGIGLKVII